MHDTLHRPSPRPVPRGLAAGAAALAGLLFGFDTAVIAGVVTPLADAFSLDEAGKGLAVSSALFGTLAGSLAAGRPGDRHGGRAVLLWVGAAFVLSAIGCAAASSLTGFVVFRFLGGLAIGGSSVLAPVFIAEISPAARRGLMVGLFQVCIVTGILLAYGSNAVLAATLPDDEAWRWKLAVMGAPGLLFVAAMRTLPDSPRWLWSRGRAAEAERAAERLGLDEWRAETAEPPAGTPAARLRWSLHRKPILLAVAIASFNQLSGINAVLYYLNDIFAAAGFAALSADLQAVAVGATNLVATLIAMTLIDRLGRRPLLLGGSVGCALALAGVAASYASGSEQWLLPCVVLFVASFALSQGAVIWVYLSEIFPAGVRARGQALGSATHWAWATLITFAFPVVAARFDQALPFWIFAAATAVQFLVVWRFFPETKQAPLERVTLDAAVRGGA